MRLDFPVMLPGIHPPTAALARLLQVSQVENPLTGEPYSEAMLLGVGGGLDFNMIQTTTRFSFDNGRTVARDFARMPPKPVFDAEVAYEDSLSLRRTERQDIRIRPWDVRRAAWWDVLSGGCGHTYGHRSFIGWMREGETYKHGAHVPWVERLDAPGATQMIHLRRLVEACRFHDHAPAPELVDGDPGDGDARIQAARSGDGRVALVYTPMGRPVAFRADRFGEPARAS